MSANAPLLVGLSGCQGSGKSTLVKAIAHVLEDVHHVTAVVLSLDDFYLTKAERESLARHVHPLFATRGVPGTHDVDLLRQTLSALRTGVPASLPVFDKAVDDRTDMVQIGHDGASAQSFSWRGGASAFHLNLAPHWKIPLMSLRLTRTLIGSGARR